MQSLHQQAILSTAQIAAADKITIGRGTAGIELMRRAAQAVVQHIAQRFEPDTVVVLAGPGNNGGDGFMIAQMLTDAGWKVRVGLLGEREALKGDAAQAADGYKGEVHPLHPFLLTDQSLVVDALFGTGLSRDIDGVAAEVLNKLGRTKQPCVAVDIPSGVNGDTGQVMGVAAQADLTVTFHRKKRGHVQLPGMALCGEIIVADIGLDPLALGDEGIILHENAPVLWQAQLPWPQPDGHKFSRGHVVVHGGGAAQTGAARLAARAAARGGAGLVSVACDGESLPIYAANLEAVMTRVCDSEADLTEFLKDERVRCYLLGPGAGVNDNTLAAVLAALALKKPVVLDADALSVAAREPQTVFAALADVPAILTPHAGEFARLFGDIATGDADKITQAQHAAKQAGAVVIYKGADTVIAAPDGRVVVNTTTSPWLATAGAGDVLAGMCAGLMAGGMPPFEAACAAVWMHGAAAIRFGAGLIAEDLPDILPAIWQYLYESTFYDNE